MKQMTNIVFYLSPSPLYFYLSYKQRRIKMARKRKSFSNQFKGKVALNAIKVIKTSSELSKEYQVHPNVIDY